MDERYQNFPKDLFYQIINNTQECHFWKDKNRRFIGVNQAFLNFYGFESEDVLLGKTDEEMGWHPDPDGYRIAEERVLEGEDTYMVPGQCVVRGEVHDIYASKHPIYDEQGEIVGLYGSFIDATDEMRLARQVNQLNLDLEHALVEARKSNKILGNFLSRASHEIRTPLHAIIGLSEIGLRSNNPKIALDYMEKIASSGHYLLNIINDILDINKIEYGNMILNPTPTKLGALFQEVEDIVLPLMSQKRFDYITEVDDIGDCYVNVDKKRLTEVLLNLFGNAIKYTPEGGEIRFICRRSELSDGVEGLYFAVVDTGCGISQEYIERIFEPFEQVQRNEVNSASGTGLGLTISKNYVKLMGGDLLVESTPGLGSTFYFTIPVDYSTTKEIEDIEESMRIANDAPAKLMNLHVLYVEDNAINRDIGCMMLEEVGMRVDACSDGVEALDCIQNSAPFAYDVILMDVQMPRMNGLECSQRIRQLEREDAATVPIIALTADVSDNTYMKAIQAGMNNCITKPIDIGQLYAVIRNSLNE